MRQRGGDPDLGVPTNQTILAGKVHYAIAAGAAGQIAGTPGSTAGHEHVLDAADHRHAASTVLGVDFRLQAIEARLRDRALDRVGELRSRGPGPSAVDEAE